MFLVTCNYLENFTASTKLKVKETVNGLFLYTVHNNGGIPEKVGFHDISSIQDKHELFCEIILMLPLPFHYSNLSEPEPMMGQSA